MVGRRTGRSALVTPPPRRQAWAEESEVFERILIAVDHSGHSREAARLAGLVGAAFGSRVRVVHVFEAPQAAELAGDLAEASGIETRSTVRRLVKEEAAALAAAGVAADGHVVERAGGLCELIEEEARRFGADLVAVGRSASATGLGVPAHTLAQELDVPLLVAAPRPAGLRAGRLDAISVAVEESPESYEAAAVAAELARRLGSELRVVHAAEGGERDAGAALVESLVERIRAEGVIAWPVVRHARVLDALRGEAEAGSGLLVTGSRRLPELRRHLLGGVSHGLLRQAGLPLLIVKGKVAVPQLRPTKTQSAGGTRP
jgi:nucleotide-binding universal stress UspA family protein